MVVTYDEILETKRQQEIDWKHPVYDTQEEALQKLGSPERAPPCYILLIAELDYWRK